MAQPMQNQENLYRNHWRKIEETLGSDSYDRMFDSFVRDWLTVLYAPEPLTKREVYPLFKRHVFDNGYDKDDHIKNLLQEMERFAKYYAWIEGTLSPDRDLKGRLDDLRKLEVSAANPLMLSFFDDFDNGAFDRSVLCELLDTLESYLLRRAACGCMSTGLNKFFSSIIGRLNKVQDDDGNYLEAFQAMLLNEAGTARRFPTDAELVERLATRDLYHSRRCLYLLSKLENSQRKKAPIDFDCGAYTIEHIMPQNAMASDEWRGMLGDECEGVYERLVHTLGNLTITAFNSELSDASFEDKKNRITGGYNHDCLYISDGIRDAAQWNEDSIITRARKLSELATEVWPFPGLSEETRILYAAERKGSSKQRTVKFKDLFGAGVVKPGEVLISASRSHVGTASVTNEGKIRLTNGEEFDSPSHAASRFVALMGGAGARNGWHFWKIDDVLLDSRRRAYVNQKYGGSNTESEVFRVMYWDGFYQYCSGRSDIVALFDDFSNREPNKESWASFGVGLGSYRPHLYVWKTMNTISASILCDNLECYEKLLVHRDEIEKMDCPDDTALVWDPADKDTKSRNVGASKKADLDSDDFESLYKWHADWLKWMRAVLMKYAR